MKYNNCMEIIETPIFTKQLLDILSDDEYRQLQNTLIIDPRAGDLIRGSGGLRKIRVKASGKGKRGGARSIYYWLCEQNQIYMLLIYTKKSQDSLTQDQIRQLRLLIELEK